MEHKKIQKEISFLIMTAFLFNAKQIPFYELFFFSMKWAHGDKIKHIIKYKTGNAIRQLLLASRNDLLRA